MFEQVPVGRLQRDATIRALEEPGRNSGLPLSRAAVTRLAAESHDYPYFIQLLGGAAWQAAADATADELTEQAAAAGIAAAQDRIRQFYAHRLNEARGRAIEAVLVPLATLVRDHGGRLGELELRPLLAEIAAPLSLTG